MGKKNAKLYRAFRKSFQENGDVEAIEKAVAFLNSQQNITISDRERLIGYIEGTGKIILPEPESLLTKASKMPGLDGQKMSKSYNNTISLRDSNTEIENKIKRMPTDPARVKLTDPGDPAKCPVWKFHEIYSDEKTCQWVIEGCKNARIGCIDCKKPLIEAVQNELAPIQEKAVEYEKDIDLVKQIIFDGSKKARTVAKETMSEVREVMCTNY